MNGYFAIFKIRSAAILQYRSAAAAGICTQFFWGFISIMIFKAFYKEANTSEPLSLTQTLSFVWLAQSLVPLLPWHADRDVAAQIRTGQVAYELLRPISLYGNYLTRAIALRLIPLSMRLPIFLCIVGFFFELQAPASWISGLGFLSAALLAMLLSATLTTFIGITLFWTLSGAGINRLLPHTASLLSGTLVPLPLFPTSIQPFLNWQPFRGIVDIPCRIYTGVIPTSEIPFYLSFQLAWSALFIVFGIYLLKCAQKRLVIQGG